MKKSLFILGLLLSVAFVYAQFPAKDRFAVKKSVILDQINANLNFPEPDEVFGSIDCKEAKGLTVNFDSKCEVATLLWSAPTDILWNNNATGNSGSPSIRFMLEALSREIYADDFEVPAGETWYVQEIYYGGFYSTSEPHTYIRPDFVGIEIFNDGGNELPGSRIIEEPFLKTLSGGFANWQTVALPEPLKLTQGVYWVSIYGTYDQLRDDECRYYLMRNENSILAPFAGLDETETPEWQYLNSNLPSISFRINGKKATDPPVSYNIYRNGELVAEEIAEPTFVDNSADLSQKNQWSVTVVCSDGLSKPVNITKQPCVGIFNQDINTFAIVPNPASDYIKVISENYFNTVDVVNLTGQVVLSTTQTGKEVNIDVSGLSNGVYFVRITTDYGVGAQRFIKN